MSATKEYYHNQIEAGQRSKLHKIGWLNMPGYKPETWNPIVGCSKVSPGCDNCYAEKQAFIRAFNPNTPQYANVVVKHPLDPRYREWNGTTQLVNSSLRKPLHWKEPRIIFVCSMGDLFHESALPGMIQMVLAKIAECRQHIFILLTKRPENVIPLMKRVGWGLPFPPNVWLGVTAENQEQANKRIPLLLQIPAAKRFVSAEPMLGPVDLENWLKDQEWEDLLKSVNVNAIHGLDWVICGGETGSKARPMHPYWVRSLRDQCKEAGTPFFFKQWGEWKNFQGGHSKIAIASNKCNLMRSDSYDAWMFNVGRKAAGDQLDGLQHHNWPQPVTQNS